MASPKQSTGLSAFKPGATALDKLRSGMVMAHGGWNDAILSGHSPKAKASAKKRFEDAREEYVAAGGKDPVTDEDHRRGLLVLKARRIQMELDHLDAQERLGEKVPNLAARRKALGEQLEKANADLEHYKDLKAGKVYQGHKGEGVGNLKTDKPHLRDGDGDTVVGERSPQKRDGKPQESPIPLSKYGDLKARLAAKTAPKRRAKGGGGRDKAGMRKGGAKAPSVRVVAR